MRKFKYFTMLSLLLMLSGCDPIDDFISGINTLLSDYLPDVLCWVFTFLGSFVNGVGMIISTIVTPMLDILPTYDMPSVDVSGIPFLAYASYFIPISEGATLIKYLLEFYTSFFVVRIILRWLKVLRT